MIMYYIVSDSLINIDINFASNLLKLFQHAKSISASAVYVHREIY